MEWLFIGATVVSLALAIAMSAVAWHLLRRDRDRSAARIEALEAMAFSESSAAQSAEQSALSRRPSAELTEPRAAIAHAAAAPSDPPAAHDVNPAWDTALGLDGADAGREQPQRWPAAPRPLPTPAVAATAQLDGGLLQARPLFDEPAVQPIAARRSLAIVAMVAVAAVLIGGAVLIRSSSLLAVLSASSSADGRRPAVNGTPLELLSLRHATNPAGSFTVTGLVQNPASAAELAQVEAVLYLFDETGQFLTSARAPIDIPTLGPGDESAFVVQVPTAATISRYRVGFRRADGRAVAHVDHRGRLPEGTTGDVLDVQPDVVAPARAAGSTRAATVDGSPR
ncbi:MAG: hypothetical protein IT184_00330 [Acidobacteria bacterium]|nr:hypothetical protein [Acidobacteriota bacterium]